MINVLDKGYVLLVDVMGSDLSVVNSARVSYNKAKTELDEKDHKLISFLARENHSSPFRHATLQFEMYAPLLVARQLWKYVVGSDHVMDAWNESSRRYITEECEFYIPNENEWRTTPSNSKQGSGEPVNDIIGEQYTKALLTHVEQSEKLYEEAMKNGICAEQARLFLPAYGMYVRWYWTASLQSVSHFLNQRLSHDAQKEIQEYAKAVKELSIDKFPASFQALLK